MRRSILCLRVHLSLARCWQEREEDGPEADSFKREVAETFLRCKQQGFDQDNAVIELNSLKIAEDRTFAEVARYVFITILGARCVYRHRRHLIWQAYHVAAPPSSSWQGQRCCWQRVMQRADSF